MWRAVKAGEFSGDRDTYVGMQWNPVNDTPLGIGTQPDSYCPELDQYGDDAAMNAARFLPKNVRNRIVKYLEGSIDDEQFRGA